MAQIKQQDYSVALNIENDSSMTNFDTKTKHGFGSGHLNTGHEGELVVREGPNGTYVKGKLAEKSRDAKLI